MVPGTRKCLTDMRVNAKLEVRKGRVVCPYCGNLTDQAVEPETRAANLPVWCRKCKRRIIVKIAYGECLCLSACAD